MIKRHVVLIASFSGIFGIIMGVMIMSLVWLQVNDTFPKIGKSARAETDIVKNIELLSLLRSGRQEDATRKVEGWLDSDLAGAGEFANEGGEFSVATLHAIASERKARQISGYEPDNARVSAAVQAAFRLIMQDDLEAHAAAAPPLGETR